MKKSEVALLIFMITIVILNLLLVSLLTTLIINLLQVKSTFDQLDVQHLESGLKNMTTLIKNGMKDMESLLKILIRRNNSCPICPSCP